MGGALAERFVQTRPDKGVPLNRIESSLATHDSRELVDPA